MLLMFGDLMQSNKLLYFEVWLGYIFHHGESTKEEGSISIQEQN
jgi:hypothetical protein